MRKDLITSALAVLVFTVLFGLAYPLAVTGVSQLAFEDKADGDPALLAHKVTSDALFHPRPSQTGYSATATAFANRGPNQASTLAFYRAQLRAYTRREHVRASAVPADAVTTSASGVDPHISPANARIQARRVARVRRLPLARVLALVETHTDGRFLGLLGEAGVDVTTLNAALEATR
jgi:potassium-transporting ATPase KdpC subunit